MKRILIVIVGIVYHSVCITSPPPAKKLLKIGTGVISEATWKISYVFLTGIHKHCIITESLLPQDPSISALKANLHHNFVPIEINQAMCSKYCQALRTVCKYLRNAHITAPITSFALYVDGSVTAKPLASMDEFNG